MKRWYRKERRRPAPPVVRLWEPVDQLANGSMARCGMPVGRGVCKVRIGHGGQHR